MKRKEQTRHHLLCKAYSQFAENGFLSTEQGRLKPYKEIVSGFANYLVHSQGISMIAATAIAKDALSKQPAWRDRNASH